MIEIIEIKITEDLEVEAQITAMLPFKTQNRQTIPGMKKLAIIVKHQKMKNFVSNASSWKKRLIEWKIRYGANVKDQKIETVRNIQVTAQKKATEWLQTIQEVRKAKDQQKEKALEICFKL